MTKPNWYADKWTDEENTEMAASKEKGREAAASLITRTDAYARYYGGDFKGLEVRTSENGQWKDTDRLSKFTEKFPFFQPIRGDGFCGLHSGIVGTLAKCVDNPYHFAQFKENLEKWPNSLPKDKQEEARNVISKVLTKIGIKNLSYQEFYDLVNERSGDNNISKELSVVLYTNSSLDDFSEDLPMQNSAKSNGISAVDSITASAVTHILEPISPFEIIAISNESIDTILDQDLSEDSVYIVGADGHFDLLHSKLDYNLMAEIAKIEFNVAKTEGSDFAKKEEVLTAASQRKKESEEIEVYKKKVDDIYSKLSAQDKKTLEILGFSMYEKTEDPDMDFMNSLSTEGADLFPNLRDTRTIVEDAIKRINHNNKLKRKVSFSFDNSESELDGSRHNQENSIGDRTTAKYKSDQASNDTSSGPLNATKIEDGKDLPPTAEYLKARNKPSFAYTDREIDAVNRARNIEDGYKYFINKKEEESGILLGSNGEPLAGSDNIKTIIEMPACAVDQGSPIALYLEAQLEHLKEFQITRKDSGEDSVYPVKILFPYKLQSWHWNVGEITVKEAEDGKLEIEGCAYDSMITEAALEKRIQNEILEVFDRCFTNITTTNDLGKKSANPSQQPPQRGGIACGLYAGIAMHNLKTKPATQVWDGADKDERTLRDEDSDLVSIHNPNSRFCEALNERGFVDIFRTKGKTTTNTSSSSSKTHYHAMARELEKIPSDTLLSIASLAEKLAFNVDSGTDYKALLAELESYKPLHNIIFPNGDSSKTIPNYQLANLAFEATLARTQETSSSPSKEETAYQNCLDVISGSFTDVVRDCAIRSPSSLVESLKKNDNLTDEEVALKGFLEGLEHHIKDTAPEEKKDELLQTANLVARMICLEVEGVRNFEITKMKSNAFNIIEKSTPLNEEAKFLVDNFATSNNPILEQDGKNYTPLAAAKEKFTAAKQELHKKLEEKIESHKIESGESGDSKEAKHTFSEEDIIKYSAKGILSKALRANAIEEIAKTEDGKQKNLVNTITFETVGNTYDEAPDSSGNLKIQFGRRYARKDFTGGETTKLEFNDPNFGNNSFANCKFTNCDFTGSSGKQLKFVNCTFDKGCVIPKDLKTSKMNFAGCKFSADIFNGLSEAEAGGLKKTLGIEATTAESEGYFSSKPNPSVTPAAAFKLNPKILTR